ncbi:hypothetical protein C1Y63_06815 [Corynebacterium sp. 13CS0277]|uniref:hypothetical protein n=1 Tax=Corynebacterium sp. 13CS0277 TaxID=2071994 RepID=UPI000D031BEA|nr:hypothetical protein [Corynebacterium sp. 13CS0277]PRQ11258.1 hypothetical protein C1Y63_06815 [Corynebacterium sp. 13CS0277]
MLFPSRRATRALAAAALVIATAATNLPTAEASLTPSEKKRMSYMEDGITITKRFTCHQFGSGGNLKGVTTYTKIYEESLRGNRIKLNPKATAQEQAAWDSLAQRLATAKAQRAVECGAADDRDLGAKLQGFVGSGDAGNGLGSLEKLFGSSGLSS